MVLRFGIGRVVIWSSDVGTPVDRGRGCYMVLRFAEAWWTPTHIVIWSPDLLGRGELPPI